MKIKRKKYHYILVKTYKFKLKYRLFAFFIILICLFVFYSVFVARPVVLKKSNEKLKYLTSNFIGKAASQVFETDDLFNDILLLEKDTEMNIVGLKVNSSKLKKISNELSKKIFEKFYLELRDELFFEIAVGDFFGITIFSGLGKRIRFRINPYVKVDCEFESIFESAGINQTLHKLYLLSKVEAAVVFPLKQLCVESCSKILISETIIVGKVPSVYLLG